MLTKCQYRGAAVVVGMTSREYATVKKCAFSLARKLDSELAVRMSFGSEFRTFIADWLSQCVSTAQKDAKRRWTAGTASSLGVVGVRRCTAERNSTEP